MRRLIVGLFALSSLAAPALAEAPSPKPSDPEQKVKCKAIASTGNLAQRERVCHTVAEWRRLNETAVSQGQAMVDKGIGCGDCLRGN